VFPSLAETFGLAAVEAAQAGLPIVANTLDVLHEVLAFEGRPCALFVDAADTANFIGAIRRLLMEDDLREALTSSGKRLSERYSLGAMVEKYASLIEELAPSCAGCVSK
jgi:L-malate glycosyltransferase